MSDLIVIAGPVLVLAFLGVGVRALVRHIRQDIDRRHKQFASASVVVREGTSPH